MKRRPIFPLIRVGLLLCALLPSRASAQGAVLRRPALHWVRAEAAMDCADPRTLAEQVEELVGPVLVRASEAEHSIEGYVESLAPGGLRVRVRVVDRAGLQLGQRVLEHASSDCRAFTPALAFVMAMMIDPGVVAHGLPDELVALFGNGEAPEQKLLTELPTAPVQPRAAAPAAPVIVAPRSKPKPPLPAPPGAVARPLQLAGLLRGAYREAPRALLALEGRALYQLGAPIALGGYLRAGAQLGRHGLGADRQVRISILDVGLLACGGQDATRVVRIHGCLGVELSAAMAAGRGFAEDDSTTISSAGVVAQLTARLRLTQQWGLAAALSARYALQERRFVYQEEQGEEPRFLFELDRLAMGLALGPTYEF